MHTYSYECLVSKHIRCVILVRIIMLKLIINTASDIIQHAFISILMSESSVLTRIIVSERSHPAVFFTFSQYVTVEAVAQHRH